ncbi:MAG: chorismate synthase [Oscillospiraceae bacterium]|jgi:chorismate synthase
MSSTWNRTLRLSIFGESHGKAIGMTLDNLPAGEAIDLSELRRFTARRTAKKGDNTSTARTEPDLPELVSGFYNGCTTGTPLTGIIQNTDTRSGDYGEMQHLARPGHADYTGAVRYRGANDIRGGGHFSGRLTAPLVLAGGICKQILERHGVFVASHVLSIKDVSEERFNPVCIPLETIRRLQEMDFPLLDPKIESKMREVIETARLHLDSVGGVIECCVVGMPAGIGSPMFDGVENVISSILFGVPAVKGVEFGDGFDSTRVYGSENNDSFYMDNGSVRTRTNHNGGILGGITFSMPIILRAAIKPTSSIAQPQQTIDYKTLTDATIEVKGRHDPCIAIRAAVVVEAAVNLAILDLMMEHGKIAL